MRRDGLTYRTTKWIFIFGPSPLQSMAYLLRGIVCCIVPKRRVCVCVTFFINYFSFPNTPRRAALTDFQWLAQFCHCADSQQPHTAYYSSDGVVSRNRRWHVNIYVNVCVVYTHRNAGTRQWSWRRRGIHCIWHKRGANWVPSAWAAGVGATLAPSAIIKTQNFNTSTNHSTKAR